MSETDETVTASSGCVFRDLDVPCVEAAMHRALQRSVTIVEDPKLAEACARIEALEKFIRPIARQLEKFGNLSDRDFAAILTVGDCRRAKSLLEGK